MTVTRKQIPLIISSVVTGILFGLSLARLLGSGLMQSAFNAPVLVGLFVLLWAICLAGITVWLFSKGVTGTTIVTIVLPLGLSAAVDLALPGSGLLRSGVLLFGGLIVGGLSLLRNRRIGAIFAAALPFTVYLMDLSPYVGRADTFEFQVVAPTLGIAHPSGYPLYVLIGKFFSWLPIGTVAWRVNLSSAVFAALACGMLYWILSDEDLRIRLNMQSIGIPILAAWILGFSPTLWTRSIEAEVYSLNAFIVTLALYIALRWLTEDTKRDRWMLGYALLTGIAVASHITLGAIALLAGVILFTRRPCPRIRTWLYAALLGIAGLSLYLYIPLRWPALHNGQWMSLRQFIDFISNAGSGGALRPLAFYQDTSRWALVWRLFRQQFGVPGLILALIGWGAWLRKQWRFAVGSLLTLLAWAWFNLSFYVADPDYSAFLIPAHVVMSVWLGYGALNVVFWLKRWQNVLLPVILSALMLLPASQVWRVAPALDTIAQGRQDELWARYVLSLPIKANAAILADSEKFPPLYYIQQVQSVRRDLELVTLFNEEQYRADMQQRLDAGQPVYMARYLPGLDIYGVQSLGPLVEVGANSSTLQREPIAEFQPAGLQLADYTIDPDPFGRALSHLTLEWQTTKPVVLDLEVHLRLVDSETGHTVWNYAPHRPVSAYSATTAWQAGNIIRDYYALAWPDWLTHDTFTLEMGLFERFSEDAQALAEGERWLQLGEITLPEQVRAVAGELHYRFGDNVVLVDAQVPGEAFANAAVDIDLSWYCPQSNANIGRPILYWIAGETIIKFDLLTAVTNQNQDASTCNRAGYTVRRYEIPAPAESGTYRLLIGVADTAGDPVPATCSWLAGPTQLCGLDEVHVGPSSSGLANFENTILLAHADFDASEVPAGGMLRVNLEWRGLRSMDADYTVFLQVIGPDGQLYGQVDSWPVQGARPTSGWQPGETLTDPYAFYLKESLPAGDYEIIVGWYLLADMRRLSVVSADDRPMGDFTSIGSFSLP